MSSESAGTHSIPGRLWFVPQPSPGSPVAVRPLSEHAVSTPSSSRRPKQANPLPLAANIDAAHGDARRVTDMLRHSNMRLKNSWPSNRRDGGIRLMHALCGHIWPPVICRQHSCCVTGRHGHPCLTVLVLRRPLSRLAIWAPVAVPLPGAKKVVVAGPFHHMKRARGLEALSRSQKEAIPGPSPGRKSHGPFTHSRPLRGRIAARQI